MNIDLEGLMAMVSLNVKRIAVDGALGAYLVAMWVWMGEVQGEAQRATVYLSLAVVLGRGVLFLLDVRARARRSKAAAITAAIAALQVDAYARRPKVFTGEHFDR